MPVNLDWTRDPAPPNITPFQRFIRDVDWAKTDLGHIETWCRELRQVVRFILAETAPIILYWGATYTVLYNEAYIPLVGQKHPNMIGKNAPDVFPEFWAYFEDVIGKQRETGVTATGEASRLLMERHGFMEETYFDWKIIPIIGDDGTHLGSYGVYQDNTERVIGERRKACVQKAAQLLSKSNSLVSFWDSTISGLSANEQDVPLAILFSDDKFIKFSGTPPEQRYEFTFTRSDGVPDDHELRRLEIDLDKCRDGFESAIKRAVLGSEVVIVSSDIPAIARYLPGLQWKGSGDPSKQFAIIPISAGKNVPAVLIIGLNAFRRYNPWYDEFLTQTQEVLSSHLSRIRLSEELRYRAEVAYKAEMAYEQSEMRFTRFADRSMIGLAVADLTGKILYANDFWCTFSGVDASQVVGSDWQAPIFEEDLPALHQWWHKIVVLKQVATFQYRSKVPYKNGNIEMPNRTAYATCYVDSDESGNVETIMGLVVDITEQKWIEEQLKSRSGELQKSEQKYRNFADLCPLGIVSVDKDGYVQLGNDSWHDFYGFKKGEVKDAQPWLPFVHDEDLEKAKSYFVDLQTKPGPHSVELRLKRRYTIFEGDRVIENDAWVLATGMQEYKDAEKQELDVIDFWVTDISAQKMAEKILTEKMLEAIRTRTQQVSTFQHWWVLLMSFQERFIDMISHEIRNPLSAVLHSAEEVVESLSQLLGTLSSKRPNGSLPVRRGGGDEKTEKLLLSSLEAANTIIWCSQHQKTIVDDVLTLSKLDSELLVVSPIPVKLSDLIQSAIRIFEPELRMSEISLDMVEHDSLTENGVDWLLLDPNRFLQILINLVTNAIKFTRACDTRRITVSTSVHIERPCKAEDIDFVPRQYSPVETKGTLVQSNNDDSASQVYLRVSVSDTGKGLSVQEKKLLFNRFAQASPKTEVEYGGSGLGLFISRQITEMLGGEVGVGTSTSGGCTFAFYIATSKIEPPQSYKVQTHLAPTLAASRTMSAPVAMLPTKRSLKQGEAAATAKILNAKRKLLVVEDNVINQKVLCKQLRNRGFEVEASNHGREALLALEKAQADRQTYFEVVLLDFEMPIMDGITCVKEIREREDDGSLPGHIPVIGVTANVRGAQVDAAIEAGMDGVTTKPYRIDDLIAHIDRLCPIAVSGSPT